MGARPRDAVATLATLLLTLIITPSPALPAGEGGGEGSSSVLTAEPLTPPSPRESEGRGSLSVTTAQVTAEGVPTFAAVRAAYQPSDVRLLDRHGAVIHELRRDPTRRRFEWTALADVSPAVRTAVVAAEDGRFYAHSGVDWWALGAAMVGRVSGGPARGASTISMQVARLLTPDLQAGGSATLRGKWRQMLAARAIERAWTKAEILETYLNLATFRGEVQGVAAAAGVLFDKAPHGLSDDEALVLAALLQGPNAPHQAVTARAERIRARTAATVEAAAVAQAVARAADRWGAAGALGRGPAVALAPHAARAVLRDGAPTAPTTLDAPVQRAVADALRRHLLDLQDRVVRDGAVLVVDNASGDVLAYVGGAGDVSSARYVDGVRARRQAGSALKPFLYATAFEQRLLTPASLLEDTPLELTVAGGLYRPRNYDERFRGVVTARAALAASLNVPAVRVLGLVGADTFVGHLRHLGFTGLVDAGDYYGPALALGSADVTLWDLTSAYRVLANGGMWSPLRLVADGAGGTAPRRVYSAAVAYLAASILADRESRASTFGFDNPLATRFWTAAKTGTSKDMRDNWCVGFSQRYTVGVWVGNFSGAAMHDVSGVTGAAPVWAEVMNWLHAETPSVAPAPPTGVVVRDIAVGPVARPEWFLDGTQPPQPTVERAAALPRILAPVAGTVMAVDPDIPDPQQRVAFEADGATAGVRWVLDGAVLGAATSVKLWAPRPGRHRLELVDADARVRDRVEFVVRGTALERPLSRKGQGEGDLMRGVSSPSPQPSAMREREFMRTEG